MENFDWLPNDVQLEFEQVNGEITTLNKQQFQKVMQNGHYSISANGVIYNLDNEGFVPHILKRWANERKKYKDLRKKFELENDDRKAQYYDGLQYAIKILSNSVFGAIGLNSFRFYDFHNAEAITITGQAVIIFTQRMINMYMNQKIGTKDKDYIIYGDTDSVFISVLPLIKKQYPNAQEEEYENLTLQISKTLTEYINDAYSLFSSSFLNVQNHDFIIKQELIARTGFWLGVKKRYALWVVNKEGVPTDKLEIKGLDTVRSNFPKSFRKFMFDILDAILRGKDRDAIDKMILDFKNIIHSVSVDEIAIPTSVKELSKFDKGRDIFQAVKATPIHVKSALFYNDLIIHRGLKKKFSHIKDSEKIKWIYLESNEFNIETIAYRGEEDPEEIMSFISEYVDREKIFRKMLINKLQSLYDALQWGKVTLRDTSNPFF